MNISTKENTGAVLQAQMSARDENIRKLIPWLYSEFAPWNVEKLVKFKEVKEKALPISKAVLREGKIEVREKTEIVTEEVSQAVKLLEKYPKSRSVMAIRKYFPDPDAVFIEDVVNKLTNFLSEFNPTVEDFTKQELLKTRFKRARQLLEAQVLTVESAVFTNVDGGVDIYAKVDSASGEGKRAVIISVTKGPEGKAIVNAACSCPVGHLICKHQLATLLTHTPVIFAAIEAVESGKSVEELLPKWEAKYAELIDWINNECPGTGCGSAVAYYLAKYLMKTGRYQTYKDVPEGEIFDAVEKSLATGKPVLAGTVEKSVKKYEVETPAIPGKEMVFTEAVKKARTIVTKMVIDLARRLGYALPVRTGNPLKAPDWVHLLVYANLKGSDYSEPPVVVGAVGDPGTGKTMGFKKSQIYFEVPYLKITYSARGGDPASELARAYRHVLNLLEQLGFISPGDFTKNVGGLMHYVGTAEKDLTVMIDLTMLLTYPFPTFRNERDRLEAITKLLNGLRALGFKLEFVKAVQEPSVIDKASLGMFGTLSMSTQIDKVLGYLRYNKYLGMHRAVLLDEATRDVTGLDNLLTQTSTRSLDNAAGVFGITSNIDPFNDMISDPRSEAIRDRTLFTSMPTNIDDDMRLKYMNAYPDVRIDTVTAATIWRIIKQIPVPEFAKMLIRTIRYALTYQFLIVGFTTSSFMVPVRRGKHSGGIPAVDLFADISNKKFEFFGGLRFDTQTIDLAKYYAFVAGRGRVETEDVIRAMASTIQARLKYTAKNVQELRVFVAGILHKIYGLENAIRVATEKVAPFLNALRSRNYADAEKLFASLISEARYNPLVGIATVSAIKFFLEENPDVDIDELPEPIALTAVGILVDEGNITELSMTRAYGRFRELALSTLAGEVSS